MQTKSTVGESESESVARRSYDSLGRFQITEGMADGRFSMIEISDEGVPKDGDEEAHHAILAYFFC